jgi:endonuclease
LRDFLAKNVALLEPGLRLYNTENKTGVEYQVAGGRIDLLCVDGDDRFVVVELKLSRGRNRALGQLLYYMGWVEKTLGKAPCRGMIVGSDITPELRTAASLVPTVALKKYTFAIEPVTKDPSSPAAPP